MRERMLIITPNSKNPNNGSLEAKFFFVKNNNLSASYAEKNYVPNIKREKNSPPSTSTSTSTTSSSSSSLW